MCGIVASIFIRENIFLTGEKTLSECEEIVSVFLIIYFVIIILVIHHYVHTFYIFT